MAMTMYTRDAEEKRFSFLAFAEFEWMDSSMMILFCIGSSSSTSVHASDMKRIESEWDRLIVQLWDASMTSIADIRDSRYSPQVRYKMYVDNLAILMQHPEDANLTRNAIAPTSRNHIAANSAPINLDSIAGPGLPAVTGSPPKGAIGSHDLRMNKGNPEPRLAANVTNFRSDKCNSCHVLMNNRCLARTPMTTATTTVN